MNSNCQHIFPYIAGVSLTLTFCNTLFLELYLNLGLSTFIVSYSVHLIVQIGLQLIYLRNKNCFERLVVPEWRSLFTDNAYVWGFLWNYSVTFWFEIFNDEFITFVFLMSHQPKRTIIVWKIVLQVTKMLFVLGYSSAVYVRSSGNALLAEERQSEFKQLVWETSISLGGLTSVISITLLFFSYFISSLLVYKEETVLLLAFALQIKSLFLLPDSFNVYLNTVLRMIDYQQYVFWVSTVFYFLILPAGVILSIVYYRMGLVPCLFLLVICNSLVLLLYWLRLIVGFRKSVSKKISHLRNQNELFLSNMKLTEKMNNSTLGLEDL